MKNDNQKAKQKLLDFYNKYGILVILLLIIIIFSSLSPVFLKSQNILAVLEQASFTIVTACGMTMILVTGCSDLSAGALVALAGMVSAVLIKNGASPVISVLVCIVIAVVGSALNGYLIGLLGLLPFMTTLSTQLIFRGFTYIVCDGVPVSGYGTLVNISRGEFLGVSYMIWLAIISTAITFVILQYTTFGRKLYAVGGNREAAKASGIKSERVLLEAFILMGIYCGIAGIMLTARTNSGQPNAGEQLHFDAITAAVIGGTSMSGGIGNVLSTFVGGIVIACINNGMNLLGVSSYYQYVVKGIIIIIAVLIDKKSREALFNK